MKKKRTLFQNILFMTVIPVVIVFVVVIFTLNSILQIIVTNQTKELVSMTAAQISEQASIRVEGLDVLLHTVSNDMASAINGHPSSISKLDSLMSSMLDLSPDIYSIWYVIEPNILPQAGNGLLTKEYLRDPSGVPRVIDTITAAMLADAIWYQRPLATQTVYYDVLDHYDYGLPDGPIYIFTITHPIIKDGVSIGCVGLDIRYEDLLRLDTAPNNVTSEKTMVVLRNSTVLFSKDPQDIGKTLDDFDIAQREMLYGVLDKKEEWIGEINTPFFEGKSLVALYPFNMRNMDEAIFLYRGISWEQFYGKFQSSIRIIYVAGILGAILVAFFVFISTRRIVQHARRLTENFRLVAAGENGSTLSFDNMPIATTNVYELDLLQSSLVAIMAHIQEVHALKIKSMAAEVENEKLVASSQAKTAFFATMSHEIRTPMNAVIGISEIMLLERRLDAQQQKNVQDIHTAANSLLTIINDIVDISIMETGKVELQQETYDFETLIDNVSSLARHLASDADLEFRLDTHTNLPKYLYGDSIRLRQVLVNLLGNAVKYTSKGFVELSIYIEKSSLHIEVADSGVGIPDADLPYIFEVFRRVDTENNRKITGTGLGLSICRNLLDLMDGSISVTSEYGVGSRFRIVLPVVLGHEDDMKRVESTSQVHFTNDLRVLVVDDNHVNLNVSAGLLKAFSGILCDTAISGMEAIAMVQKTDYDIVFMDHMMPEMDGVETTQRIRAMGEKYKSLPIIALTANAVIGTREELLRAGLDGYINKPIQRSKLEEVLRVWIPQEKHLYEGGSKRSFENAVPMLENPAITAFSVEHTVRNDSMYQAKVPPYTINDARLLALEDTPHIDLYTGLDNIGYDEEMYIKSLILLSKKIPESLAQMYDMLEQGSIKDFQVSIHGMKGSLLSIGVAELAESALSLERASASGDSAYCVANLPAFAKELERFDEMLRAALSDAPTESTALEKPPKIAATGDFSRLYNTLASYDYEEIMAEWAITAAMEWSEEEYEILNEAKTGIDNFEYAAVAELLAKYL